MISNTGKLAGKTIVITGASRGFGADVAVKVAKDGANVVVLAKTTEQHAKLPGTIYETSRQVKEAGGQCLPIQLDVRNEEAVCAAIEETVTHFGGIDAVINNASAMYPYRLEGLESKRFLLMNDVIVKGSFFMAKHCVAHLKKSSNPHIINICPPINVVDSWFKHLNHLAVMKYSVSLSTLALSQDLRDYGIGVNGLWPKTAFWSGFMSRAGGYTDNLKKYCRKPGIMSDAAYVMLCQNSKEFTGQFCFDDDILQHKAGVADFEPYAEEPGNPLIVDIFVRDEDCKTFTPLSSSEDALKMLNNL
jgi:NAD(P)-dependent dehydrogenase (short-subunit alcohol dehydrogenase family)